MSVDILTIQYISWFICVNNLLLNAWKKIKTLN
jgi:hypothetical protein